MWERCKRGQMCVVGCDEKGKRTSLTSELPNAFVHKRTATSCMARGFPVAKVVAMLSALCKGLATSATTTGSKQASMRVASTYTSPPMMYVFTFARCSCRAVRIASRCELTGGPPLHL